MKMKRQSSIFLAFAIGTSIFVSAAAVDVNTLSGYGQLKDTLKNTVEQLTEKTNDYTTEFMVVAKSNGRVLGSYTVIDKHDRLKKASESEQKTVNPDGSVEELYLYRDPKMQLQKGKDGIYYLTELAPPAEIEGVSQAKPESENPFKVEGAQDIERIIDALVGNLKDYVVAVENPDGTKVLSGSVNEVQIPALINALASFQIKQMGAVPELEQKTKLTPMTKDIFIKHVKGTLQVNKDGLAENFFGAFSISGKDNKDGLQELSVEVSAKVTDINQTAFAVPDLTNEKVEKLAQVDSNSDINPKLFEGKFKNDIVVQKNQKFIKVGERILDIQSISQGRIQGIYSEQIKPQYAAEYTAVRSFAFEGQLKNEYGFMNAEVSGQDAKAKRYKAILYVDVKDAKINFSIEDDGSRYPSFSGGQFSKVFELE